MPSPYDYSLGNVPDPSQAFTAGLQRGNAILQLGQQRQQQQLAAQTQQQQMEQQQARFQALQGLYSNPNPTVNDYVKVGTLMPDQAEHLTKLAGALSGEQKRGHLAEAGQVAAALRQGRPDVAKDMLSRRIELMGESDPRGAAVRKAMLSSIEADPKIALDSILLGALQYGEDGKRLVDSVTALAGEDRAAAKAPAELRTANAGATKAEADATTAVVTAKYAERGALAELEKKGWDIKSLQADIEYKKQDTRIKAMNAAIGREGNDLKREELKLKIEEARTKIDTTAREKVAEFDQRIAGVSDARTLIKEIKEGGGLWAATGITATAGFVPGSDARTAKGKIEQLTNVLAAENLDKLKGAMSDKDIAFLKNIASNLDRWQSTDKFTAELDKVDAALVRGDAALRKKYGAPPAAEPVKSPPKPAQATPRNVVVQW